VLFVHVQILLGFRTCCVTSVNNRYVIALHKKRENQQTRLFVGTIFNNFAREIPQFQANFASKDEWWQFRNRRGDYYEQPYFLSFENFYELLYWLETSEQIYSSWSDGLLSQINRAKAPTHRKVHEPLMYKMAVDVNFRAEILDLAYSETKPSLGLLPEQIDNPQEFYEGASQQITVNIYERNPKARSACIEHYGAKCIICDFDFQRKYGEIGKDFIHVHHTKPLGEIGAEYKVDPINDLCPVCPNCHAMLHRRKPPFSINELRSIIKR